MAISTSLVLLAIGAVLALAIDYELSGVSVDTIGVILMVVGGIGLLFSMLFLASFAPFGGHRHHHA